MFSIFWRAENKVCESWNEEINTQTIRQSYCSGELVARLSESPVWTESSFSLLRREQFESRYSNSFSTQTEQAKPQLQSQANRNKWPMCFAAPKLTWMAALDEEDYEYLKQGRCTSEGILILKENSTNNLCCLRPSANYPTLACVCLPLAGAKESRRNNYN